RVVDEHAVDRGVRLGHRGRDHDALARCEAIGLHHDRRAARRHVGARVGRARERLRCGGGGTAGGAELLCGNLRALEARRRARAGGGRKMRGPAAGTAATPPAASGASGPTTVRPTFSLRAKSTSAATSVSGTLVSSLARAVPPLPGATYTRATRGDCASFHAN